MSVRPTMDKENGGLGSGAGSGGAGVTAGGSGGAARPSVPQISVYGGLTTTGTDRQTVQVIQQALQPSAAQYLHRMYAAQQQHLMLQTAALQQQQQQQQQHLSNTQLQGLAAAQQSAQSSGNFPLDYSTSYLTLASLAAGRQGASPSSPATAQSPAAQSSSVNLSPSVSQPLIGRAQGVASAAGGGITQQAVLLGNATNAGALTQAQMYLRAQMLILTPGGPVAALQPDTAVVHSSTGSQSASTQVQTLGKGAQTSGLASVSLALKTGAPVSGKVLASPKGSVGIGESVVLNPAEQLKKGEQQGIGTVGASRGSATATVLPGSQWLLNAGERGVMHVGSASYLQNQAHHLASSASGKTSQPVSSQLSSTTGQHKQLAQSSSHTLAATMTVSQGSGPCMSGSQSVLIGSASTIPRSGLVGGAGLMLSEQNTSAAAKGAAAGLIALSAPGQVVQPFALAVTSSALANGSLSVAATAASSLHSGSGSPATGAHYKESHADVGVCERKFGMERSSNESKAGKKLHSTSSQSSTPLERHKSQPLTGKAKAVEGPGATCRGPGMTSGIGGVGESRQTEPHGGSTSTGPFLDGRPPQAIVKPQILTHVIEGFIIQEGSEPFPVERRPLEAVKGSCAEQATVNGQLAAQRHTTVAKTAQGTVTGNGGTKLDLERDNQASTENKIDEYLKCEFCGKMDLVQNFKKSRRFCSTGCVKRYNVSFCHDSRSDKTKRPERGRVGRPRKIHSKVSLRGPHLKRKHGVLSGLDDSSHHSDNSSLDDNYTPSSRPPLLSRRRPSASRESSGPPPLPPPPPAPHPPVLHREPSRPPRRDEGCSGGPSHRGDPARWSVQEVWEFVSRLPGCRDVADEFRAQEIDGQALLLLKEDHLMTAMNLKLGPALKICAWITRLKES
uniref:polyhomeotic-like protein 2 n=2 Tax=Myxine glutinosa TaxID=7769 RepID=UPI00358FF853